MRSLGISWAAAVVCLVTACGGDSGGPDTGTDLGAEAAVDGSGVDLSMTCTSDLECDDGIFCNGVAHCSPGTAGADARGCVPMTGMGCIAGQTCVEASRMCLSDCDVNGDADSDGHRSVTCGGDDCDDGDPNRYPGNTETCDSGGRDEDCDPATLGPDHDSDGFVSDSCCNRDDAGNLDCGTDCDDTTMDVSPTAPEVCDGIDDNCEGRIDEGVLQTFYRDADGDSFGIDAMTRTGCSLLAGYAFTPGDCDDMSPSIHPGASETCNTFDDDCDGMTDPGCSCVVGPPTACGPSDGMGGISMVGACHAGTQTCIGGTLGDCVGAQYPGSESCNTVDDDCDGMVDEGVTTAYYRDADGDGYGVTGMVMMACGAPSGYATVPNDCNDARAVTYPGAPETCNAMDDDCDGLVDESVTTTYFRDADGDGYGNPMSTIAACAPPAGYITTTGDCNDAVPAIHPGAPDGSPGACDMIDNNCDGTTDPGCTCTDGMMQACGTTDGMGGFLMVGLCHPGMQTCSGGAWGSCSGNVNPTAETCNGLDDNCNGTPDDGALTNFYRDCDHDGYGATGTTPTAGCMMPSTPPTGCTGTGAWVANNTDCNDVVATTYPMATERCNNVDDNCDTVVDATLANTWCSTPPQLTMNTMTATCTSATSTCVPATCVAPYLACDLSPANGCEANGNTDAGHCGSCTSACVWNCETGMCDDAVDVTVGGDHACARRMSGQVVCWGSNGHGRLGDGTTTNRSTAVIVSGITDAVEISAGQYHTCARRASGAVSCWGRNDRGQLGDGSTTDRSTPVAVTGLTDAVEIAVGSEHTCARRMSGQVVCWGYNFNGQLGDGSITERHTFVNTTGLSDAVEISAGGLDGTGVTCARRTGGAVVCWGDNANGQLGDGSTTDRHTFVSSGISDATAIGVGLHHVCALRTGGTVSCWGDNGAGQLGDATTMERHTPVAVSGLTMVTSIATGGTHSCALKSDATMVCWGAGPLGAGGIIGSPTPVAISLTSIVEIDAGAVDFGTLTCVRRSIGSIFCWGNNSSGQVGDGTTAMRNTPTVTLSPP